MADPTDDLSAGDSTPKLGRASIKDITLAINRISYTIKTPDDLVTPDALQVSSDGNFSMGDIPLSYSVHGRSIYLYNGAQSGTVTDGVKTWLESVNGSTLSILKPGGSTGYGAFQVLRPDMNVAVGLRYRLDQAAFKIDMYNAATTSTNVVARFNPTGELVVGDTTNKYGKVMVLGGTVAGGSETMLYMQPTNSSNPSLISGVDGGILQLAGGQAQSTGKRGGQIDLYSASNATLPGVVVVRSGLNTDGLSSTEVARFVPTGRLGVGLGGVDPQATIHAMSPDGTRGRMIIESINDYGGFTGRRSNGTYAAQTNVVNGNSLVYLNAQGYAGGTWTSGPIFQAAATEDWATGKCGSSWTLQTVANGTSAPITSMYWANNGYVGINNTNPQARLVVSNVDGGAGFEVQTSSINQTLRSYNRSTNLFQTLAYQASNHVWGVGGSTNVLMMTLASNGALGLNTTNLSGGSGNTAMASRVVIAETVAATALTIAGGVEYAGLKFKISDLHATSGGANYYDVTVRPADFTNGVANQADKTLIRFEASSSMTPRLLLQPEGGTQQVVIGAGVTTGNTKLIIESEAGWESPYILTVGKNITASTNPNADMVLRRAGAVSATAGKMPWIQFESTDAAFAGNNAGAIGSAANAVQIWCYVSNAWALKLDVAGSTGTTTSNNSLLVNGQSNQSLTIRGPAASNASMVLQSNQSFGVANWITSKTTGFMHIGGNGSSEPAMGPIVVAPSSKNIGLWPLNETQMTYTYSHGGTITGLHVNNTNTTQNSQAQIYLASGITSNVSSAIGGLSWVLPNIASDGTARVANIGAETDDTHTAAQAAARFVISTKKPGDSTSVPRVRVRASGNVTFGNTLNDTARLYIYNEGRNVDGVRMDMSDTSNTASSFVSMRSDTSGYAFSFLCGGNIAGAITHPSLTTTVYGTGSDRRIKKNIVDASSAGPLIDQIRVVQHDFVADDYHVPYGFIAQELHLVYPNAVTVGDDAPDVGPDSRIWQVDNSKLVPLLLKEIQELRTDRDSMKTELAELRELLNVLLQDKSK